jgi:pimeloyl-ACP methyl ester carboxylesterase
VLAETRMSLLPVRPNRSLYVVTSSPNLIENPEWTLFFVHGSMASSEQWRFQIDHFKKTFRIVAYDYFGCGNSPRPEDDWNAYSTEEHLADLLALFDQQKTAHNILIGHSFGASQVVRLAKERKAKVDGVVLVASAILPNGGHPIFFLPDFALRWLQPRLSKAFLKMALHPQTLEGKTAAQKELIRIATARSGSNSMRVAKSFYRQIKFMKEEEVRSLNGNLPVLVLCGSDDPLGTIPMAETLLSWLLLRDIKTEHGKASLEIVGPAAHQVMEEQPQQVNAILSSFFQRAMGSTNQLAAL